MKRTFDADGDSKRYDIYDDGVYDPQNTHNEALGREINDQQRIVERASNSIESDNSDEKQLVIHRSGYVYSPAMMLHAHPASDYAPDAKDEPLHPEVPERISKIHSVLDKGGCLERMKKIPIREATMNEVMKVHDPGMWDGLERLHAFLPETLIKKTVFLEKFYSLYVNQHSAKAARLSCGGVIELCDAVASRRIRNGFAIVRPPGHHAEPDASMGFCFYNNVAVAVRFLQQKYGKAKDNTRCERILILDWDVHHGNGTQKAFYDDPNVLLISIHRYDGGKFYPCGTAGDYTQCGAGEGLGKNINIPWSEGKKNDGDYIAAFQRIVMPIAIEFSPDIVLISAGFDAAEGDELGECFVTPAGYGHMTDMLSSLADGRLIVALEGGYNLDAISRSALHVTEVLLGDPPEVLEPDTVCGVSAHRVLKMVERQQSNYWKCMEKPDHEPEEGEDDGIDSYSLARLFASHRIEHIAKRFNLLRWPTGEKEPYDAGQVLSTPAILEAKSIILFAHDMGNLRMGSWENNIFEPDVHLMKIVDDSSRVLDWAQKAGYEFIDVGVIGEHPTRTKPKVKGDSAAQALEKVQKEQARNLLLLTWDNIITMLTQGREDPVKVILMGMGSACDAILNLIAERKVDNVVGVVQIPGYDALPSTSGNWEPKRKWYYRHSQVFVPYDHTAFQGAEDGVVTAKRFGKLIRSDQKFAVQVLSHEFEKITDFIESKMPPTQTGSTLVSTNDTPMVSVT
ncbi:Arginase/deacetylase [Meira miltonrushii]|uniref:histone deacetylase n=1 Tax=Meira miltonrushii TaxID=1280837 RepID=A0A316VCX3_9BASI|nr:Arginase/deacetylase [Meira miltonrushii]PWN33851.1 Arginase/deacetylase [Meira miltonrushii]